MQCGVVFNCINITTIRLEAQRISYLLRKVIFGSLYRISWDFKFGMVVIIFNKLLISYFTRNFILHKNYDVYYVIYF